MAQSKKIKLDAAEKAIEKDIAAGNYVPVENLDEELRRAKMAAKNTVQKTKSINIRISQRDLVRLRAKAMAEGVPYQTYISSLIHKSV